MNIIEHCMGFFISLSILPVLEWNAIFTIRKPVILKLFVVIRLIFVLSNSAQVPFRIPYKIKLTLPKPLGFCIMYLTFHTTDP